MADKCAGQVHDPHPRSEHSDAVVLLLAVEHQVFAITAKVNESVAAQQMGKTNVGAHAGGPGTAAGLHRFGPGTPICFCLCKRHSRDRGIPLEHLDAGFDRRRREHDRVVVEE